MEIRTIPFKVEPRGQLLGGFEKVLSTIGGALKAGVFRPRTSGLVSKNPCIFCDYQPICGPGHVSRYEKKEADRDPAVVALAALEEIP